MALTMRRTRSEPERTDQGATQVQRTLSTHPEAVRAREHRRKHPERQSARRKMARAIQSGLLVPGPCEVGVGCSGRIEGHHDDYASPLTVRWFCKRHHRTVADRGKAGRPETSACPKCGTVWSVAASGTKYCRPCGASRMRQSRAQAAFRPVRSESPRTDEFVGGAA